MWPFDHQFQTYTWPSVFGWVARNTPGNIVAGFIQAAIAGVIGVLIYPPTRRAIHRFIDDKLRPIHEHLSVQRKHMEWQAEQQAKHMEAHGITPDPHPVAGILDRLDSAPTPPVRSHKRKTPEDAA